MLYVMTLPQFRQLSAIGEWKQYIQSITYIIRHASSRIELELQEVSIVVGNLQSASQEQKTILDQAFNHIATHESLLENIHKDLQPFQGRELLPERQLPTPKRLGAPVTQSTNTDSTSEENAPWSTIIALRLKERVKVN